jgi:hypothetical protein
LSLSICALNVSRFEGAEEAENFPQLRFCRFRRHFLGSRTQGASERRVHTIPRSEWLGKLRPCCKSFSDLYTTANLSQTLVAVVGPSAALIGADAAVHLAEELKDAAYVLPRAMVSSALINYATAFIMIISFVSAIVPDTLDDVLTDHTGKLRRWVSTISRADVLRRGNRSAMGSRHPQCESTGSRSLRIC